MWNELLAKNSTKKLLAIFFVIIVLAIVIGALSLLKHFSSIAMKPQYDYKAAKNYEEKLIAMLNSNGSATISEVFDFSFDRGFVIKESYLRGDAFAKEYGLDISVEQMMENNYENTRRIVFVDKNGNFVYEFRYQYGEPLSNEIKGLIIYPETKIIKVESFSGQDNSIGIEFVVDQDDYLIPEFDFEEYNFFINNFSVDMFVEEIDCEEKAIEQADKIFRQEFTYIDENEYGPFLVYYNKNEDVWLIKRSLPKDYLNGFPSILVKSNGQVLALWHYEYE